MTIKFLSPGTEIPQGFTYNPQAGVLTEIVPATFLTRVDDPYHDLYRLYFDTFKRECPKNHKEIDAIFASYTGEFPLEFWMADWEGTISVIIDLMVM